MLNSIFEGMSEKDFIEIREINNNGNAKQHFLKLEELKNYKIPQDTNIYYGVYSRSKKNGTGASCNNTGALYLDFDNMKSEQVKEAIEKVGLPKPSIYVNSGHGIHTYWLLENRAGAEAAPVIKAMAKATGADTKATDIARILRLPNSMNVKKGPVKCELIESNGQRYSLELFKNILGVEDKQKVKEANTQTVKETVNITELSGADRPCIKAVANGVKEGHRNFILGRITKYLQVKGYTKEKTKQIILLWNSKNTPPEDTEKLLKDFEAYWRQDYKLLGCAIKNSELQSILYDYCDRMECKFSVVIGGLKLDNSIKYNNRLFNNIDKLTGNDLIVLGLLNRHKEGLTTSKLNEKLTARAIKKVCISKPTLIKTLSMLQKLNFINCIEGNKRAGKENLYKVIPQGTYGLGYTICSNGAINGAIDGRVTPGEFKLYVLLLKYAFGKGNCYPSLDTLAKDMRTTRNSISMQLNELEKADYIKRNYGYLNNIEKLYISMLV